MSTQNRHSGTAVSRRRFLGGSMAAAVGTLSVGGLRPSAAARDAAGDLSSLRPAGAADEAFWRRVRREFNIVDEMTYLNTGTLGPMPRTVFDAQMRYTRELVEDPRGGNNSERTEGVRSRVAAFIGADPDEVVLTRSTTEGVKIFCAGLDLQEGDEVLMSTHEHPGGFGPWHARELRHGIKVNTVQIPAPPESVDQIVSIVEGAMTPRTRVLLVSHPIFVTGTLMPIQPLAEMAHRRDVLVSVDGAHALGMIDLDMHAYGIDHYTTAGQKWLLAGTGTGVAYFRKDVLPKVWTDLIRANDTEETARKFERSGQRHMPSQWAMGDAIDFHSAIGKGTIEARIHELAAYLRDGLREIPGVTTVTSSSPELSGGLTTFFVEGVPSAATRDVLLERFGIFVAGSGFNPSACRVSTHLFVSKGDLDRLLEGVRYVTTNAGKLSSSAA